MRYNDHQEVWVGSKDGCVTVWRLKEKKSTATTHTEETEPAQIQPLSPRLGQQPGSQPSSPPPCSPRSRPALTNSPPQRPIAPPPKPKVKSPGVSGVRSEVSPNSNTDRAPHRIMMKSPPRGRGRGRFVVRKHAPIQYVNRSVSLSGITTRKPTPPQPPVTSPQPPTSPPPTSPRRLVVNPQLASALNKKLALGTHPPSLH